jgi:hypothetical protein
VSRNIVIDEDMPYLLGYVLMWDEKIVKENGI